MGRGEEPGWGRGLGEGARLGRDFMGAGLGAWPGGERGWGVAWLSAAAAREESVRCAFSRGRPAGRCLRGRALDPRLLRECGDLGAPPAPEVALRAGTRWTR